MKKKVYLAALKFSSDTQNHTIVLSPRVEYEEKLAEKVLSDLVETYSEYYVVVNSKVFSFDIEL